MGLTVCLAGRFVRFNGARVEGFPASLEGSTRLTWDFLRFSVKRSLLDLTFAAENQLERKLGLHRCLLSQQGRSHGTGIGVSGEWVLGFRGLGCKGFWCIVLA